MESFIQKLSKEIGYNIELVSDGCKIVRTTNLIQYSINDRGCFSVVNIKPTRRKDGTIGYVRVYYQKRYQYLHRVAMSQYTKCELIVCHKCDNTLCFNPDHLFLGTNKDNTNDALNKGRFSLGDKHYQTKFSNDDIYNIRDSKLSLSKLAKQYSVSKQTIQAIIKRKTWKHI